MNVGQSTEIGNSKFTSADSGVDDVRDMGAGSLSIVLCVFTSNKGTNGGAINSKGLDELVIESCTFAETSATGDGGAVFVSDESYSVSCNCVLRNDSFVKGTAERACGAFWITCKSITVDLCELKGCSSGQTSSGSSAYLCSQDGPEETISIKSTVFENEQEAAEYVIYPYPEIYLNFGLYNCTFDGTGKKVGQLCWLDLDYMKVTLEKCIFKNVEITLDAKGALTGCTVGGTGIQDLFILHCRFESIKGQRAAAISAGVAYLVSLDNCTFVDCTCSRGDSGAIVFDNHKITGALELKNIVVEACCSVDGTVVWLNTPEAAIALVDITVDNFSVSNHGAAGKRLFYLTGKRGTKEDEHAVVFKKLYISDVFFDASSLVDIPRMRLTYQDCIFTNVTNIWEGGCILQGPWTTAAGMSLGISVVNCSFIECHSKAGTILFVLGNGQRSCHWDRVAVTSCRFVSCTGRDGIVVTESTVTDQVLLKSEVTGTQFVDCEVRGSVPMVRLEPKDSWIFESNNMTGLLPDAPISLGTATEDMEVFGCSFDNAGGALRGGYLNFVSGDYRRVKLEQCRVSNVILNSENVFLFLSPKPANLEELQLVDCVFDSVRMEKVSMIAAASLALVVNGSTFRSCTSPTGIISLDEQGRGVTIERCVFDANVHQRGADGQSVCLKFTDTMQASALNISDTVFSNHEKFGPFSAELAGALSVFEMTNCTFRNNKITESLGVLCFVGSNIDYTFSECEFSECSVESPGGQLIWLPSTGKAFSQFALQFCEFTSCGSGSVIASTSEQNGDLFVENCSVMNSGFSLAFSCSRATFSKCYFLVSNSTAEATIKLSARGETVFSDSTFIFVDNAADTKRAMIQYVGGADAKVTFRDCCFATDVVPASQFVAFLSLEGQGSYTFEGSMCFDLPNSRAVRANRGIVGSDESMFACGNCTRRGGDLDGGGDPAKKGQMPPGAIAGIVIVVLLILILLLLLALYIIRKRRYADFSTTHAEEEENPEETITTTADTTSDGGFSGPGFMSEENPLWKEEVFQTADQTFEERV